MPAPLLASLNATPGLSRLTPVQASVRTEGSPLFFKSHLGGFAPQVLTPLTLVMRILF